MRTIFKDGMMKFIMILCFLSAARVTNVLSSCQNSTMTHAVSVLDIPSLKENSGIDFSRVHKDVFWALNDSGNSNEIFAINLRGKLQGKYKIEGATNIDWEDIAVAKCFDNPDKECIYLADFGNNFRIRRNFTIYVVEEPSDLSLQSLKLSKEVRFTVNGSYNFEALSVNEKTQELYFISKSDNLVVGAAQGKSIVFTLRNGSSHLEPLATINFKNYPENLGKKDMIVTSSDFDSLTQMLLIGTYGKAFEVALADLNTFNARAKSLEVPSMKQAEAIAYHGYNGKLSIYTTSEGINQPLYQISCD